MNKTLSDKKNQDYTQVLNQLRQFISLQDNALPADSAVTTAAKEYFERDQQRLQYWNKRAALMTDTMRTLERDVNSQFSGCTAVRQIAQGFMSLSLRPASTAQDYLSGTSLEGSQSEALRNDWLQVGDHVARAMQRYQNG